MTKDIFRNEITHDIFGNSLKKSKGTERGTLYSYDKDKILQRQKGLCAGKECAKMHHGKKMPVNIRSHFDHIKSLRLGGKDDVSNIRALCANCHQLKTREDRKAIAISNKSSSTRNSKRTNNYILDPISGKKTKLDFRLNFSPYSHPS